MDELLAVEGPSMNEELQLSKATCNFSSITTHEHDEFSMEVVWWSNVVCLPLIALIGLTCNLLNIAILTSNRAARRIPSWTLLLALAVCDCFFLIFATLDVSPMSIPALAFSPTFNFVYSHISLYIRTIASTFYKSSVLLVVAFNLERYICVVHPLTSHRICTGRTSRLAIICCVALSAACSVQWPLCYEVKFCYEEISDTHFYAVLLTENTTLKLYYRVMDYLSLLAFNVIPIIALLAMNVRIIVTLRRVVDEDSRRDQEKLADGALVQESSSQGSANAMLFAVVLMLLVCVGPQAPARIILDWYGQYHSIAIVYISISQQLVFLNASLNFCLYSLVSKRYRSLMRQTIKRVLQSIKGVETPLRTARVKSLTTPATSLDEHPRNALLLHPL